MPFPPLVEPGPDLAPAQATRYARHLLLPGVGALGQRRLAAARVLVVGAGGLGSPALLYLAAAGVGTLGIVDDDTVDVTNLQRQVVHTDADVGRPKVESARERVLAANPHVTVRTHPVRLTAANALEILGQYDLVLDGADNFATRYLVDDACAMLGIPDVWGSILGFDGQVSVFWAAHGPTYRDLFPVPPDPGVVPSCAEGGVLGALCATVGSVMVTEAVKLVCGIGDPLVGRLVVLDALGAAWRTVAVRPDPARAPVRELADGYACAVAAPGADLGEVAPRELAALLGESGGADGGVLLVDVREPGEHELMAIPGAVNVPLARFEADPLAAAPPGRRVVLYCKTGGRSARALAAVRAAGHPEAAHLAGGVLAWVRDVEPGLPVY